MYLRISRRRRKDRSTLSYFRLAHDSGDPVAKRSRVSILHNIGRADSDESAEALRRLARSILARLPLAPATLPSNDHRPQ